MRECVCAVISGVQRGNPIIWSWSSGVYVCVHVCVCVQVLVESRRGHPIWSWSSGGFGPSCVLGTEIWVLWKSTTECFPSASRPPL